jgi:hypothetical protein
MVMRDDITFAPVSHHRVTTHAGTPTTRFANQELAFLAPWEDEQIR